MKDIDHYELCFHDGRWLSAYGVEEIFYTWEAVIERVKELPFEYYSMWDPRIYECSRIVWSPGEWFGKGWTLRVDIIFKENFSLCAVE